MRALFATTGGIGHFGPLVPFARACQDAGHEVVVAAPESFSGEVTGAGLRHAPIGEPPAEVLGRVFARLPTLPRAEAEEVVVGEVFGRLDARAALPGLRTLVREWRPDLLVREPAEIASLVVAEAAGLPHAQVAIGMGEAEGCLAAMLLEPLHELAEQADVDADRATTALTGMPRFSCVPEPIDEVTDSLGLPAVPARGPLCRYRADVPATGAGCPPPGGTRSTPWSTSRSGRSRRRWARSQGSTRRRCRRSPTVRCGC